MHPCGLGRISIQQQASEWYKSDIKSQFLNGVNLIGTHNNNNLLILEKIGLLRVPKILSNVDVLGHQNPTNQPITFKHEGGL